MDAGLGEPEFARLAAIATSETGIVVGPAKRQMMASRLARLVRASGLADYARYADKVERDPDERRRFLNAMTTNLTAFFRESHHFEQLRTEILPELLRRRAATRRIRIWSAGCSTGQEPYSIAMVLASAGGIGQGWDLKVLATDIDSEVLDRARSARFPAETIEAVPAEYRGHLQRGLGVHEGSVRVRPEVAALVTFRELNLQGAWPMTTRFDVIFCRNVMIYFDKAARERVVERFAGALADDGWLVIGHSEALHRISSVFTATGRTVYQKAG